MMLREWDDLPDFLKCDEVRPYYDSLANKKTQLGMKKIFDVVVAALMLMMLAVPMAMIAVLIKLDSDGPVFYRQERVTAYGKKFKIHKFRTMAADADKMGAAVTVDCDVRITRVGKKLRSLRLDEIPQLLDVLSGNMSFVGTRPEIPKYVRKYTKEMRATLLLPAGITSEASIKYKDEAKLLGLADDVDKVYVEKILSQKMRCNLESIRNFSCTGELVTMFRTVFAVLGRGYM